MRVRPAGNPEEGFHFYRAPWTFTLVGATDALVSITLNSLLVRGNDLLEARLADADRTSAVPPGRTKD